MSLNAWNGVLTPPLTSRLAKPRHTGWTMVIDKGLPISDTLSLLETADDYIDLIKLTFGTSALYPEEILRQKVQIIRDHGISVFPGGTLLEIAVYQGKTREFLSRAKDIGFDLIEVSDGTITMNALTRYRLFNLCRKHGFRLISEVGKKDPARTRTVATGTILADLANGAEKVIIEARESGKGVGIYDQDGGIIEEELAKVVQAAPVEKILWEAPLKVQQKILINSFGPNVNLGNIPADNVIALEALRLGLRADTLGSVCHGLPVTIPAFRSKPDFPATSEE